jgi:dihydrofolate reductase
MNKPFISIIAAFGSNRELGKNNKLLWHLPPDMARFKKITTGHPVIMGRKTFESMGKPLSNRTNIIITSDINYQQPGCISAHSINQAITEAQKRDKNEIFIIGGGQIYKQGIELADKLYLTIVEGLFDADTFFPEYPQFTKKIFEEKGSFEKYTFTFLDLEKG